MNKYEVGKAAAELVVFSGVNTVVDNAVKKVMPHETSIRKRVLAKIGGIAVSAAITHVVTKEVEETIEELKMYKDMVYELKEEAIAAAKAEYQNAYAAAEEEEDDE